MNRISVHPQHAFWALLIDFRGDAGGTPDSESEELAPWWWAGR